MSIDKAVAAYGAAWLEEDAEKRAAHMKRAATADLVYADPSARIEGRDAMVAHIGAFHTQRPGARIEITSGVSSHNGHGYFGWQMVGADGAVQIRGVDFVTIADDGRMSRIVGFFGDPPAA